jgi:hypothetical protein
LHVSLKRRGKAYFLLVERFLVLLIVFLVLIDFKVWEHRAPTKKNESGGLSYNSPVLLVVGPSSVFRVHRGWSSTQPNMVVVVELEA